MLSDAASRGRYATDASIYQVEPLGVLVPASDDDVRAAIARLPRASRAGAAARRRQLAMRADGRRGARHRPQQAPRPHRRVRRGAADRHRRAGHRARRAERVAAPARPVVSGRRQHVGAVHARRHGRQQLLRLALDRLRQHGAQRRWRSTRCSPTAPRRASAPTARCRTRAARMRELRRRRCARSASASATRSSAQCRGCCAASAATTSTSSIRRASGRTRATASVNFAHLLVGSEGTLAWTRALTLKLAPLPAHRALGVVNFDSLHRAMECARASSQLGPSAVELVDRTMIDLARANPAFRPVIEARADRRARGDPARRVHRRECGDAARAARRSRRR